jgi:16S rRNA (guanine527-N7)-methyltransferase
MFHVEQTQFVVDLIDQSSTFGIELNDQQASACDIYCTELLRWNEKVNLTSIKDKREIAIKHFVDSFACVRALKQTDEARLLDVGSGAGFPGLPLKILRSDLTVTLLEPNGKKTAFLRHVIGTLNLTKIFVVSKTLNEFSAATKGSERFTYIVTRAVAAEEILPLLASLLAPGGRVILCRTKPFDMNAAPHGLTLSSEIAYDLPSGYGHRIMSILQQGTV